MTVQISVTKELLLLHGLGSRGTFTALTGQKLLALLPNGIQRRAGKWGNLL